MKYDDWLEEVQFDLGDPSGIDFQIIEQEGRVELSDVQRREIALCIYLLNVGPPPPYLYPAKEMQRRLRRGIAAGYQFLELLDFLNDISPIPFECEVGPRTTKEEFLASAKETFDNYILFCNRIKMHLGKAEDFLKEYQSKRGRSEDLPFKNFVFDILTTYEQAGGKVKVSWNTRSQHYTGAALAFVKSVLTQAGRAPQSDDALAQLILTVKK